MASRVRPKVESATRCRPAKSARKSNGHEGVVAPGIGQHRTDETRTRDVEEAVVTAGDAAEGVGQEVEHLREGERQHHEVDALPPDRDPADDGRHEGAQGQGQQQHEGGG